MCIGTTPHLENPKQQKMKSGEKTKAEDSTRTVRSFQYEKETCSLEGASFLKFRRPASEGEKSCSLATRFGFERFSFF